MNARLSVPASVRPVARVHVPAEAWNATGAILRGRHVNPAIGIHKADDLDAGGKSTRQAIGYPDVPAVNRPGAQPLPGARPDGRRIARRRLAVDTNRPMNYLKNVSQRRTAGRFHGNSGGAMDGEMIAAMFRGAWEGTMAGAIWTCVWGWIGRLVGDKRGRPVAGAVLGILLGPLGPMIAMGLEDRSPRPPGQPAPSERLRSSLLVRHTVPRPQTEVDLLKLLSRRVPGPALHAGGGYALGVALSSLSEA